MDVWSALKEEGIFIYSTCTFNSSENEDNIRWLLKQEEAEVISLDISRFEGITEIDRKGLAGYGFHPGRIRGEGLFISVLRKKGRTEKVPKARRGNLLSKPPKDDLRLASEWTTFDPGSIMRCGEELLMTPGNRSDYDLLSGYLRIIKHGTGICTVKNRRYLPSHELALSTGLGKNAFPTAELDYKQAVSFLKRESIKADNLSGGWFVAVYRSVNIGFANNIGQRVNNYFPVGWRIRMDIPSDAGERIIRWEDNYQPE
jgi:NOL1/NOP2/fmu family ribosome biogenesis protein